MGFTMSLSIQITNGTECYVNWTCKDVNGLLYTPTSLSYQVWDITNNIEVVGPTNVAPAQIGTITLSSTVNTMNTASTTWEARQVTVKVGIPGGTYRNDIATYNILRKAGTP